MRMDSRASGMRRVCLRGRRSLLEIVSHFAGWNFRIFQDRFITVALVTLIISFPAILFHGPILKDILSRLLVLLFLFFHSLITSGRVSSSPRIFHILLASEIYLHSLLYTFSLIFAYSLSNLFSLFPSLRFLRIFPIDLAKLSRPLVFKAIPFLWCHRPMIHRLRLRSDPFLCFCNPLEFIAAGFALLPPEGCLISPRGCPPPQNKSPCVYTPADNSPFRYL